jgi:hypothetical protein
LTFRGANPSDLFVPLTVKLTFRDSGGRFGPQRVGGSSTLKVESTVRGLRVLVHLVKEELYGILGSKRDVEEDLVVVRPLSILRT